MRGLWALALAAALLPAGEARAASDIRVDVSQVLEPVNRELLGLAHNAHSPEVEDALRTRLPNLEWMRVDTFFDDSTVRVADGSVSLDHRAIDARLASVARSGARPLLILDYMPPAMAERTCAERSRFYPGVSRCPPADYAQWTELVRQAVRHACCETNLVTGLPNDVRWFEVWNEPDFIGFFAGTIPDYLEIYRTSDDALRTVEKETGAELFLGGGAFLFPDPPWIQALLAFAAFGGYDLDFLSWHYYANYPLFGPFETLQVVPELPNPLLSAGVYRDHTEMVRAMALPYAAVGVDPLLWINEWNINAGADARHETGYATAFTAASLHAMQDAGLDRGARFNTQDDSASRFLTWGMFDHLGAPKPVFHAFQMWDRLETMRVAATGSDPRYELGALASRSEDGSRVAIVLYNFDPVANGDPAELTVDIAGIDPGTYLETVYAPGDGLDLSVLRGPGAVSLPGALEEIVLPPNGIALVELTLGG